MEAETIAKPESLRDQAFQIVKSRVLLGQIKPGEIWSAATLAQQLGVSTSPVREALLSLVDLGLMEAVRNRGFRVIELNEASRHKIIDIRMMLELPAMLSLTGHREALAARRAEIEPMLTELEETARRQDLISYLAADRHFHLTLIATLGNERLTGLIEMLRDQTMLVGLSKLYASVELMEEARSHRLIWQAILAGESAELARLMHLHMCANAGPDYTPPPLPPLLPLPQRAPQPGL